MADQNNFPLSYEVNASDLQNIQNQYRQSHVSIDSNLNSTSTDSAVNPPPKTWSETIYHGYTYAKIAKDVYDLSKIVSPAETVRRIAKYTVSPVAGVIDYYTGLTNYSINVMGLRAPFSFSAFGRLGIEALALTLSPAQWAAYHTIDMTGRYVAKKTIRYLELENREAEAAIMLGSSLFLQQAWGQIERNDKVQFVYETCKQPLSGINNTLNKVTKFTDDKIINKAFEKAGVDTVTPLGLTAADVQRENNLINAEKKLADAEEKLELLIKQEKELEMQLADAQKNKNLLETERAKLDAINIKSRIQQARQYEKTCMEKKTDPKYKESKKFRKIIANELLEIYKKENNLSEVDAKIYTDDLRKELKHAHGEEKLNKVLKKIGKDYKVILETQSQVKLESANQKIAELQQSLDHTRRAKAKTVQRDLTISEKTLAKAMEEFQKNSSTLQQMKFKEEQSRRQEERLRTKISLDPGLPLSGNIQFEMSLTEIENLLNDYIKDSEMYRNNFNDNYNKVFLDMKKDGKIRITQRDGQKLQIAVPIRIDNKRNIYNGVKGKVTEIKLNVLFDLQLQESSPERLLNADISNPGFYLKNDVFFKVLAAPPKIGVQSTAYDIVRKKFPEAMLKLQSHLEKALGKENIINHINKNIPEGMSINESIISIKAPIIKNGVTTFDVDVNADFQYRISADALQKQFKPFEILGGCSINNITNVTMSNSRVKADLSFSGPIEGTFTASFETKFLKEEQRFVIDNLQFDDINTNSKLVQIINELPKTVHNWLPVHSKIEENFNHILQSAPSTIVNHLKDRLPFGTLAVDADSASVTQISFDNDSVIVNGTISSDNYSTDLLDMDVHRSGFSYRINTEL